jgi:hypothetical protein
LKLLPAFVAAATAAASATTTTASAERPLGFGTGFVDVQRSAIQLPAIEFRDGAICIGIGAHLDKSETSRLSSVSISNDADALHCAISFKERPDCVLSSSKIEVSYENILHLLFPFDLRLVNRGRFERGRTGRTKAKMPKLRLLYFSTEEGLQMPKISRAAALAGTQER